MPHVVVLDPDQSQRLNLHVIVEAATGVIYQQQCNGYYCDQRSLEGFLIPVGGAAETQKVYGWFWTNFTGYSGLPELWTEEKRGQLAALVAEVRCWYGRDIDGRDAEPHYLQLDTTRMDQCVEAWIPVVTPYGRGILTLINSD